MVDACFGESDWFSDATSGVLSGGEESSTADVALIAAAVALASCYQVSKPAARQQELLSLARRRKPSVG